MRHLLTSVALLGLAGCGAAPTHPELIVNQTQAGDAVLQQDWQEAQAAIAQGQACTTFACWQLHPADQRALGVQPRGVVVQCQADVPVVELARTTGNSKWLEHSDPSNTIWLSGEVGVPVHGWTEGSDPGKVVTACSGVAQDATYEFENVILGRLGYDISER